MRDSSSSTINVLWGFANIAIAYLLIYRVGDFSLRSTAHVAALGLGFLLMGLMGARLFGAKLPWRPLSEDSSAKTR